MDQDKSKMKIKETAAKGKKSDVKNLPTASVKKKIKRLKKKSKQLDTKQDRDEENVSSSISTDDEEASGENSYNLKREPKTYNKEDDLKTTIFLRNVSFNVDNEALEKLFGVHGPVTYARVVRNPQTGLSRGVAFVKFKSPATQSSVLLKASKAENDAQFTLEGRRLLVSPAVSRDDASRLHTVEEKAQQRQNAHLATVGLIREGSKKAENLSEKDLHRMNELLRLKKAKLRDPNIFVSDRRLCLHYLPRQLDDRELKEICLKNGGKGSRITECRIMRDLKNGGRSLGYGFVEFDNPKNAFQALQSMNCNPHIFGANQKPMVEFSMENRRALELKERRKAKFQAKQESSNGTEKTEQPTEMKPPQVAVELPVKKDAKLPKHLRPKKDGGVKKNRKRTRKLKKKKPFRAKD